MRNSLFVLASLFAFAPAVASGCGGDSSSTVSIGDDAGGNDATSQSDGQGTDGSRDDAATTGDASTGDAARGDSSTTPDAGTTNHVKTVFIIMMENHSLTDVQGSSSAPYYNNTLIPMGARALNYSTPPGNHPSEPNYLWLEAGDNFGIKDDNDPSSNHQSTTDHLVTQLENKGISWKAYAEDIDGQTCPLTAVSQYAPKHTPMIFFDDVTNTNSTSATRCITHVRPLSELATDLAGTTARYNFITPNLCNDMHGSGIGGPCSNLDDAALVKAGDDWLNANVPAILASAAYRDNGALFILWDEGSGFPTSSDGPVPFLLLSPLAKTNHSNQTAYTHSSLLRTVETIFGVPFLRGAAGSTPDLGDLFTTFP